MSNEQASIRVFTDKKLSKQEYFLKYLLPYENQRKAPEFDRVLVFDTETTTDLYQNLKFGYFEIYQRKSLEKRALFYDPDLVKSKELEILNQYAQNHSILLYTIDEFRVIFLQEVFELETLCVGFNLPFDLTRIAIRASIGRAETKDSFSLELSKRDKYPRLHIHHISNTLSFISWSSVRYKKNEFRGHFLDLRTVSHALTDKKHTLESACKTFKTEYQKNKVKTHGKINPDYVDYCINDVRATFSLYKNAKTEFDTYELGIPITKAFTPASIGKQFLKKIGVRPFLAKNSNFPKEIIGHMMNGYFGGRTECKIRKTPVEVDVLDFLSMYPTVCTLQNLWKFVIARKIGYKEATREITDFVDTIKLEDIQNKETWTKLSVIVLVQPEEDILPIRAKFGQKHAWNIGICHVSSKQPLWYSLADVVASKLYTGKTPKIIQAYKFFPIGTQDDLGEIQVQGITINPYKDDLFKKLIEYRRTLQLEKEEHSEGSPEYSEYDRKQKIIKIITNAISYGIFVEITTADLTEPKSIDVYGLNQFQQQVTKLEDTGLMFNPIIAIAITSASRLLLAATEIILSRHNVTHAYCDTDSMMILPEHTREVQEFFQILNPYNFEAKIFKTEREKILFYGISAKRYCLYHLENNQTKIHKDDYSAHGLGHLLDPLKNDSDEESHWHMQIWQDILESHYGIISDVDLVQKYQNKYAIQKLAISTPFVWKRFDIFNRGKNYQNQIKPSNFALVGFENYTNDETGEPVKPLAPYQNPAKHAVYEDFIDYNQKNGKLLRGVEYWKNMSDLILEYLQHPESKFNGDRGVLQRKHVIVSEIKQIGKESNDLDESEAFGLDSDSYVEYEDPSDLDRKFREAIPVILQAKPKDVKPYDISKQVFWNSVQKINSNQIDKISSKIKVRLLNYFLSNNVRI